MNRDQGQHPRGRLTASRDAEGPSLRRRGRLLGLVGAKECVRLDFRFILARVMIQGWRSGIMSRVLLMAVVVGCVTAIVFANFVPGRQL